jgi:hypothetical protein
MRYLVGQGCTDGVVPDSDGRGLANMYFRSLALNLPLKISVETLIVNGRDVEA